MSGGSAASTYGSAASSYGSAAPSQPKASGVKKSAAAILFVHNHPSGDPTPSEEDIRTTKMLIDCGNLLRIKVVDHLVIGDGRYVSMQGMGYM